ncbi:rhodopsin, GQ-coupled [Aplysia californica]|uniref:Rhodopsin, GQ-coupled n=1 Tax=Aplysia californica TaxID=6500 RepID=A0ABM1A9W7_APLCA|nr:rhodopsin, GQ-coupled [Aplysia californica]XP_035828342.1 rhodopsin, GQ-coupled [Aplysia californica]
MSASNGVLVLAANSSAGTAVTWDSSANCNAVPYTFHLVVGIFITIVGILAVVGNVLVLCTFARHSSLRTSSNLLVVNLTVADLVMSSLDFPILAISSYKGCWVMGFLGCQVYGVSSGVAGLVTINTLAAISVDRFVVVVHRLSPMHQMGKSTTGVIIIAIWALSVIWAVLPITGVSSYRLEGMGTSCTFDYASRTSSNRWFFIALVIFNFFIPLALIIFSYWRIYASVRAVKRELKLLQSARTSILRKRFEVQAEIKTAITALVIISIFCLAWTPYVIIAFVGLYGPTTAIDPLVSMFPNILAKISTVSNPILYSIGHPEVRKKMKKLFLPGQQDSSWRATSATAGNSSPAQSENMNNISLPTYL